MPGAAPSAVDAPQSPLTAPAAAPAEVAAGCLGATIPVPDSEFAAAMVRLGPFGAAPRLVAGVSGGPHSLALALLASAWARARGGTLLAVICDHGLRPESGAEALEAAAALTARGIATRTIRLGLAPGPGAQARARMARLEALLAACAEAGAPWLLLGHHRADQAETLLLRALAGSGEAGLAAMQPARVTPPALVLRPLLGFPPARLEACLAAAGLSPARDPSNRDPRFERVRLRAALADPDGAGPGVAALAHAAVRFGARRAAREAEVAARLAAAAMLRPEGFARLDLAALGRDAVAVAALGALIRAVGGRSFAPARAGLEALLERGEGTLGGAELRRGGLLLREGAAIGPPVPARQGAFWDGRFRLAGEGQEGCVIDRLGPDAARLPRPAWMPARVAQTLPAVRCNTTLVAVPALAYPSEVAVAPFRMWFAPGAGPVT